MYIRNKMQQKKQTNKISHLYQCYNYYLKQYMRINTFSFVSIETSSLNKAVSIVGRAVLIILFTDVVSMSMFQRQTHTQIIQLPGAHYK